MDKTHNLEQIIYVCAQHFLYCMHICHCHIELLRIGLHLLHPLILPPKILKLIIFFKEPTVEEWSEEEMEEVSISIHREEISEGMATIQEYWVSWLNLSQQLRTHSHSLIHSPHP